MILLVINEKIKVVNTSKDDQIHFCKNLKIKKLIKFKKLIIMN